MSKEHTPGPWEVYHGEMCTTWIKSRHSIIATIPSDSVFCAAEVEQNARLIASAPDMENHLCAVLEHIAPMIKLYEPNLPEHPVIASIRDYIEKP